MLRTNCLLLFIFSFLSLVVCPGCDCLYIPIAFFAGSASVCILQATHTSFMTLHTLSLIWQDRIYKH